MEDGELFFFFFLLNEESLFLYQYFNSHLLFGVWTHVLGVYFYIYIYFHEFACKGTNGPTALECPDSNPMSLPQ